MKSSATHPDFSPVTLTIQLETARELAVMYHHAAGASEYIRKNIDCWNVIPGTEEFGVILHQLGKTLEPFINERNLK